MKAIAAAAFFALSRVFMKAEPIDVPRVLEAISQEEGGAWGKNGGVCNISYSAWGDRSELAYQLSRNEASATPVYRLHIAWIEKMLAQNGVRVTAQTIGTAWRFGIEGARRRKWKSDYGARCLNLYEALPATKKQ